jgi:DNA-directed RNA polymerase specialized sigma24 family protein
MDISHDSISEWFGQLKTGEADAAQRLWNRYYIELLRHAKLRISTSPPGMGDEEDVVLSVFGSIWRGATEGRFANITNRDELWWLLLGITKRKAVDHIRRETAQKRRWQSTPDSQRPSLPAEAHVYSLDDLVGSSPTPDFLVSLEEQYAQLLGLLRDDQLREIVALRIEGRTVPEIAQRMSIGQRAVERKLQLIREKWKRELVKVDSGS